MKNKLEKLIFHTAICAGASQIDLLAPPLTLWNGDFYECDLFTLHPIPVCLGRYKEALHTDLGGRFVLAPRGWTLRLHVD